VRHRATKLRTIYLLRQDQRAFSQEVAPVVTLGWGALFGAAVWAVLPEATLPALGLAPPPWERPPKQQAVSLGEHAVFGIVTESVRRPVRAAMGA